MANEVELKFDVENGGARAIRRSELLAAQPCHRQHYDTLYYDSEDGALRKAGYTLRIRGSGDQHVQTIKCKTGSSAGLFVRQEWESEVPGFVVDLDMLKMTPFGRQLDKCEMGTLMAVNSSAIDRTSWVLEHQGSRIQVDLDEGKIAAADRETTVCEVELELKFGKADALFALAEKLGQVTPLRLGVLSKSERGELLARDKIGRAAKAESTDLPIPDLRSRRLSRHRPCLPSPFPAERDVLLEVGRRRGAPSGPCLPAPPALGLAAVQGHGARRRIQGPEGGVALVLPVLRRCPQP